jgi:acyl carrier protein
MTRRAVSPAYANHREVAVSDKELFDAVVRQIGIFLETDVSHLRPDSHLARDLDGLSSLKLFELMLYLEDSIGFDFDEKVVDRIDTMQQLLGYIKEHRREPGAIAQTV